MSGKILDFYHRNENCNLIADHQRQEENSTESNTAIARNGVVLLIKMNSSHVQLGLAHTNGVRRMARVHMPHPSKLRHALWSLGLLLPSFGWNVNVF